MSQYQGEDWKDDVCWHCSGASLCRVLLDQNVNIIQAHGQRRCTAVYALHTGCPIFDIINIILYECRDCFVSHVSFAVLLRILWNRQILTTYFLTVGLTKNRELFTTFLLVL